MTLKKAHSLLNIPSPKKTTVSLKKQQSSSLSQFQIQEAFRIAAKKYHPDISLVNDTKLFRDCHDAKELLLDFYIRNNYVPPQVVESVRDIPSTWTRSFQLELITRFSLCVLLAGGCYYNDYTAPERRKRQIRRRDAGFAQFGPARGF
eukprot:CAMPEP_0194131302 /NCGR_PEP_ID=MMETSP0152-20130528/2111_1 /TAXON_ID=1049557 /ORGANISM="Thalassiothrix antarctica, Strain L6-D1" /LENGTH=147 /DNA_ID=CAMNT_0038826051 /DNA_START=286 /DNA_END=729 /DNA_ORIENTATION=+